MPGVAMLAARDGEPVVEEGDERTERRQEEQRQSEGQHDRNDPERRHQQADQKEVDADGEDAPRANARERVGAHRIVGVAA